MKKYLYWIVWLLGANLYVIHSMDSFNLPFPESPFLMNFVEIFIVFVGHILLAEKVDKIKFYLLRYYIPVIAVNSMLFGAELNRTGYTGVILIVLLNLVIAIVSVIAGIVIKKPSPDKGITIS